MPTLLSQFTSTGIKLFWHQEAMQKMRDGKGMPIVTHVMPTDVCNYRCAFCSVQYREGNALPYRNIHQYLVTLKELGLKAVIISGGGNPLLYRCPETKQDINDLVDMIHGMGLEIGFITNGVPLADFVSDPEYYDSGKKWDSTAAIGTPVMRCKICHWADGHSDECQKKRTRKSWKTMRPETLDKLTWVRLSLAGWDHPEKECFTPDIDPSKTTLGASYVLHDIYNEPLDTKHGRVSTVDDLKTPLQHGDGRVLYAVDRLPWLKEQMAKWAATYKPEYVRLLPNCLEPSLIPLRANMLQILAEDINPNVFFVQVKPPRQPHRCLKGYPHPVLNCDGWVYPCDSVVLNKTAGHKFGEGWRICRWDEIGKFYSEPIRPNVPNDICPGCVFSDQVDFLSQVADGLPTPMPTGPQPKHINFV